ncbi:MAG: hypothetical protein HQK61_03530, partial [Desulfamplus sp.]|nr:hypothetical protein [Desulfamplus sp.]
MFGKKKKNESPSSDDAVSKENPKDSKKKGGKKKGDNSDIVPAAELPPSGKKKWKIFPGKLFANKKLLVVFLVLTLLAVGVAGFVVYKIYFSKKSGDKEKIYVQQELANVLLAEEVIRFTYDFIPELYDYMIIFNSEVIILENELKRLAALGEQFPDQIKITDKEINSIEKEKTKLQQTYEKLQKRIESLYVSYRTNQETGAQQIQEQKNDIVQTSKDALTPVLEITNRIKASFQEKIPEGFVNETIFKVRKKIKAYLRFSQVYKLIAKKDIESSVNIMTVYPSILITVEVQI